MKKSVLTNFLNKLEEYQSNHYGNIDRNELVNAWRILPNKVKEYIKPNPKELQNLYRGADGVSPKKAFSFTNNKGYAKFFGTYVLPFSELKSYEGLISTEKVNKLIDGFKIDFSIGDDEGEVIVLNPVWNNFDIEKYRSSELAEDLAYMHVDNAAPEQDKYMMGLEEGDDRNEMVYWHGGNLDDYSESIAQRNGRYEFGAGLYMTTSYEVVKRYTKGSRKLYKITVEKGVDINDAFIDLEKALSFINTYTLTAKRKSIIQYLSKYIEDGKVPADIFNNLILNHKAIQSTKTKELRNFLINNGIDYEIVDNAFGFGEKMMVLYNMKKIKDVKRITSKDKIDNYNLLDESLTLSDINELPFKQEIENLGGKLYSVGGAVRDKFLGKDSKDLDVLITGISFDELEKLLSKYGRVDAVGKSFGILKFKPQGSSEEIDIAIPRTERATGEGGHKGFEVTSDHALPIEKDLERRDFTINAIAKDAAGNIIDPYGGQEDLKNKIIRIVNPQAFSDDPLRMLRAVQFAARFGFMIEPKTEQLIKSNASRIKEIPAERILTELDKIVKKGDVLYGADLLRETGLYEQIFGSKSPVGSEDHWDLDAWNNVKTMGEYIYLLVSPVQENPAEFYKKVLKGDIPTYKEIQALQTGFKNVSDNPIKNRVVAHNMYTISPESLNSKILPQQLLVAAEELNSGKYPKGFKELAVTGNDLIDKGLSGKELGDKLKSILLSVYSDAVKNDRNELLNF
jgi:tRNA nucleotidyltransferase/poly(A) polymerase